MIDSCGSVHLSNNTLHDLVFNMCPLQYYQFGDLEFQYVPLTILSVWYFQQYFDNLKFIKHELFSNHLQLIKNHYQIIIV